MFTQIRQMFRRLLRSRKKYIITRYPIVEEYHWDEAPSLFRAFSDGDKAALYGWPDIEVSK